MEVTKGTGGSPCCPASSLGKDFPEPDGGRQMKGTCVPWCTGQPLPGEGEAAARSSPLGSQARSVAPTSFPLPK